MFFDGETPATETPETEVPASPVAPETPAAPEAPQAPATTEPPATPEAEVAPEVVEESPYVKCIACGVQYSKGDAQCPNCGQAQPR
jgi:hypothetical protein